MLKKTIHTFEELDKWLSDNYYFEDGHVLAVNESPIEIIIGYNVKADYKANSERHILAFKLIPSDVTEWTFDKGVVNVGTDNYIIGIEASDLENGVCLEFDTPVIFRLCANYIEIEEQELIKTTFEPWVSETEMFLVADLNAIPKPQFWIEKLKEHGHDIVFRYYAGDERQPEQVPYPDYQGYYIQIPERIHSTQEGIFLNYLNVANGKLSLSFENKDNELQRTWLAMTKILAELPNAKIKSGNCEFTGAEWIQYLKGKILPSSN